MADFALHGAVLTSEDRFHLKEYEDAYVVCEHGRCAGVFETLPPKYASLPVEDFWDKLIIPGLVDLHTHAPQFAFRGTGGDLELLVVGHHGSRRSTCDELLEEITPEAAIISVGANNGYGHPTDEVLYRLADHGVTVYRTDLDGTITLSLGES